MSSTWLGIEYGTEREALARAALDWITRCGWNSVDEAIGGYRENREAWVREASAQWAFPGDPDQQTLAAAFDVAVAELRERG